MNRIFNKRSLLQSQKLLRRERALKLWKIFFVLVLLLALIYGLSALSYAPKWNIQNIVVSGNSAVSGDEIKAEALHILEGNNFLFFSRANILWFAKNEIINSLEHKFLWIDKAWVNRAGLRTIVISVKEREPVMVWCGERKKAIAVGNLDATSSEEIIENKQNCQLMDALGYVFAPAPEFSGTVFIKLYGPVDDSSWRGAHFYNPAGLNHIFLLTKGLSEIGYIPVEVEIVDANQYDVFLESGSKISVESSDPVNDILSNLASLLSQKTFADSQMDNFSNLLYIDARFGNKLFYKFK